MTRVLIASTPIHGHVMPLRQIATDLAERGHHVTFVTGSLFANQFRDSGIRFVPLRGNADFDIGDPQMLADRRALPGGPAQLSYDMRHAFADRIPAQHESMQLLLEEARRDAPAEPVVVLYDTAFMGMWPVMLGAPGIRPACTLGIGIVPLTLSSVDTAPFGLGLPPDDSESGRARNLELNAQVQGQLFATTQAYIADLLRSVGATQALPFFFDAMVQLPDHYLQLSIEQLDYPRSDAPANLRYIGALPIMSSPSSLPEWWGDVLKAKQVVAVTQGTMANTDLGELIEPTLRALADLDVLVVVAVGREDFVIREVPANARVAGYIPFDELLPHVQLLISNGGYGGVQQALRLGVPLVLAGQTEDKIEVNARAAYAGAAINLQTSRPEEGALRDAVTTVLNDRKFGVNARRLEAEYARREPLLTIADLVEQARVAA